MNELPSDDRLYKALIERDTAFLGVFVVGVKTTGVFCRVGCPAKRPKAENCEFFSDAKGALHAGYRACLRCRPLDRGRAPSDVVTRLQQIVESDPKARLTDAELSRLGIEPSTARRQFLRHCGMTFHAYQRARRMGMALQDLRKNRNVTRAMGVAGYESPSGFGAAFQGIFGRPPSEAEGLNRLLADWIQTPLGPMVAIANDEGLCLLEFHDRRALEREIEWVRKHFKAVIVPGKNRVLAQIAKEIGEYFEGERREFETSLVIEGSDFQRRVWRELQKIAPGRTKSYSDIARAVGSPAGVRAVGRANGDNRLAIVVPCHRVIRADGEMCGYGGGIWRKKRLLDLEAAPLSLLAAAS